MLHRVSVDAYFYKTIHGRTLAGLYEPVREVPLRIGQPDVGDILFVVSVTIISHVDFNMLLLCMQRPHDDDDQLLRVWLPEQRRRLTIRAL